MATTDTAFDYQRFLAEASSAPGVYQMYDTADSLLYIGKAKNLKKRLSSYFRPPAQLGPKTRALVRKIAKIEVTITTSEVEALLLEQNLIKAHRPPYNILLRDDKSYPYIFISDQKYPKVVFHRGPKRAKGQYFGPFPSSQAVRETLNFLQKLTRIRQCEDSFFSNRSRPCLQHQIQRCSAPCVGLIDIELYARDVELTQLFLQNREEDVIKLLGEEMQMAAESLAFERAAELRDRIASLQAVRQQQVAERQQSINCDVFALAEHAGLACAHVLFVRQGRLQGSRSFYPTLTLETDGDLLTDFIAQYYLSGERSLPHEILAAVDDEAREVLSQAIEHVTGMSIAVNHRVKTFRQQWLQMAQKAAEQNLKQKLASRDTIEQRFVALEKVLSNHGPINRIECFDISHSSGEATVASCVVFDRQGAKKSDYRRFNIDGITAGDDYAAMEQALSRRYKRLLDNESPMPDIVLIDGGKGQLTQAMNVFTNLGIKHTALVGVAKGTTRKAGFEQLFLPHAAHGILLPDDSPALHLIQQIRDEAHRFAVAGHTARRDKARTTSPLQGIAGVGPVKRRALLTHFGGLQGVKAASVHDLQQVDGISELLAEQIYAHLHSS